MARIFLPHLLLLVFYFYSVNCCDTSSGSCLESVACPPFDCLHRSQLCDGSLDCPNGIDEGVNLNCNLQNPTMSTFTCLNGLTISLDKLCDCTIDCPYGYDERYICEYTGPRSRTMAHPQKQDLLWELMNQLAVQKEKEQENAEAQATCNNNLLIPDNGKVELTGNKYKDTATYSCQPGFELVGNTVRVCGSNGQWNGEQPQCRGSSFFQFLVGILTGFDSQLPAAAQMPVQSQLPAAAQSQLPAAAQSQLPAAAQMPVQSQSEDGGATGRRS